LFIYLVYTFNIISFTSKSIVLSNCSTISFRWKL